MAILLRDQVSYLREHSVGSILRSSVQIYRENFLTLFLIYTLPVLPFVLVQQAAVTTGHTTVALVAIILSMFVGFITFGAIAVALSDICLGDRPGVMRSYRRLSGATMGRLAWSNFLQMLVVAFGFVLLIIPGLIFAVRLVFTPVVATLENVSGRAALKRSATLGNGFHWRNAAVIVIFICVGGVIGGLAGLLGAMTSLAAGTEGLAESLITQMVFALLLSTMYPFAFTCIILMYYDLRVRKEAYDLHALGEDLRR